MTLLRSRTGAVVLLALLMIDTTLATDGYFQNGFGMIQQGRGGAGVALPMDTFAAAINPAGLVFVGNRIDFGITLFRPIRQAEIIGNQLPPGYPNVNGGYDGGGNKNYYVPEIGFSRLLSPKLAVGVAVYGNGGMDTTYTTPIPLLGSTNAGVDVQQMFLSPSVSYKLNDRNSIGVALNVVGQQFHALGLQNFATPSYSISPGNVSNQGYSTSFGSGFRVGWLSEVGHGVKLGATYQSRTYMSLFDRYKGLFAEGGDFDIPANFAGGISVKVRPRVTLALDVERILYGQVKSIANSDANQAPLGAPNGPGFGWHDITVEKTGFDFKVSSALTLRTGYNHAQPVFDGSQTFFNILAPGVVQHHVSFGGTWQLNERQELTLAYIHAFKATINGVNSIPPTAGGGNVNLSMYQDSIGVAFAWKGHK